MMYNMTYNTWAVGTAELREAASSPKLRALLKEHSVVRVGRYRATPDAVVVRPDIFDELVSADEDRRRLQGLLELVTMALRTGAALPMEMLAAAGLTDDSWQTLNLVQHHADIRLDDDPEGNPIVRVTQPITGGHVEEFDEELVVIDED